MVALDELVQLKEMIENLGAQLDELRKATRIHSKIIDCQNRMIDMAVDELLSLEQMEAIPPFFRKQIAGTLGRIREIEFPHE